MYLIEVILILILINLITIVKKEILFATRIKANTVIHVAEELPTNPSTLITREAIVRIVQLKHLLHLVETVDSEGNKISILCNDASKSGQKISALYRTRWQIELFFKWVKQHLVLKKLYGKSMNSVFNHIYIAMITFCLTLLMKHDLGYKGSLLKMFDWISDSWSKSLSVCVKELFKKSKRTSCGRRKIRHQQIFEETLAQYESGTFEHLNDVTYDPGKPFNTDKQF